MPNSGVNYPKPLPPGVSAAAVRYPNQIGASRCPLPIALTAAPRNSATEPSDGGFGGRSVLSPAGDKDGGGHRRRAQPIWSVRRREAPYPGRAGKAYWTTCPKASRVASDCRPSKPPLSRARPEPDCRAWASLDSLGRPFRGRCERGAPHRSHCHRSGTRVLRLAPGFLPGASRRKIRKSDRGHERPMRKR